MSYEPELTAEQIRRMGLTRVELTWIENKLGPTWSAAIAQIPQKYQWAALDELKESPLYKSWDAACGDGEQK